MSSRTHRTRRRRFGSVRGTLQSVLALSTVACVGGETFTTTIATDAQSRLQNVGVECHADSMCLSGLSHRDLKLAKSPRSGSTPETADTCLTRHHRNLCTTGLTGCGIQLAVNATHQIYTSEVSLHDEIVRWQCVYPLESPDSQERQSKSRALLPVRTEKSSSKGSGAFLMSFLLYDDPDYTRPMRQNPNLDKNGLIRARVFLLDQVKTATIQLSKCWATPFADSTVDPFYLINDLCPVENTGAKVDLVNSGTTHYATFESGVFKFENSDSVYLHCNVRVCFRDCQVDCSGHRRRRSRRSKRSLGGDDTTISLGPISVTEAPLHVMEMANFRREFVDIEDTSIRLPPGVLWTMVLTLILCAGALTLILIKWLLDETNLDKSKIMPRSRTGSITTETTEDSVVVVDKNHKV